MSELPFVDLELKKENVEKVCVEVIRVAGLGLDRDKIHIECPPSIGLINTLYKCSRTKDKPNEAFIVKNYTEYVSFIKDRHHVTRFLNQSQLGPKHLALFKNGVAMEFVNGHSFTNRIDPRLYNDEKIWKAIAKEMARWHQKKNYESAVKFGVNLVHTSGGNWIMHLDKALSLPAMAEHRDYFPSLTQILEEEESVRNQLLERGDIEPSFAHVDPNSSNIIFDNEGAHFIDFDFAGLGFTQYDIAWFLQCFLQIPNPTFEHNPSPEYERKFVTEYLRHRKEFEPQNEIETVDNYIEQLQKAKLLVLLRMTGVGPIFVDFAGSDVFIHYSKECWKLFIEKKAKYGLK